MKVVQLTMMVTFLLLVLVNPSEALLFGLFGAAVGGYAACQTACNVGWVACYASAGITAGTVTAGAGVPMAALVCNAAQGACMAACAASFVVL